MSNEIIESIINRLSGTKNDRLIQIERAKSRRVLMLQGVFEENTEEDIKTEEEDIKSLEEDLIKLDEELAFLRELKRG